MFITFWQPYNIVFVFLFSFRNFSLWPSSKVGNILDLVEVCVIYNGPWTSRRAILHHEETSKKPVKIVKLPSLYAKQLNISLLLFTLKNSFAISSTNRLKIKYNKGVFCSNIFKKLIFCCCTFQQFMLL